MDFFIKNQIQILNGEVTNRPEPLPFGNRGNRAVFFGIFNHGCDSPSVYLLALGKGANSLICATKMREECLREFEKEMQT
jgi:hypothetical protein